MAKARAALLLCAALLAAVACADRQQYARQRSEQCRLDRLEALEPSWRVESEAGISESWDHNHEQFQCAGVSATRHTIEPKGLLLPSASNSPRFIYLIQGEGYGGLVIPGCPESFTSIQESGQGSSSIRKKIGEESQIQDEHQKIHHLRPGHFIAIPAGFPVWFYNSGNEPAIAIVVVDTGSHLNQLDNIPRRFFLGGSNPNEGSRQSTGRHGSKGGSSRGQKEECNNLFAGFDTQFLAQALGVSEDTARKMQWQESEQKKRGFIVRVEEQLRFVSPRSSSQEHHRGSSSESEEERRRGGSSERRGSRYSHGGNGIEETICYARIHENIGDAGRADVFSREAGHLTSLNSLKLPLLQYLQFSAEKGHLHRNALMGPLWNANHHSIVYVIGGSAQVQIVDSSGNAVLDERVREGQIFVVPQNYAVLARAEEEFRWVSFKTSDNAVSNNLAGKGSTLRAIPVDVLANSYQISREEARRLKEGRSGELGLFAPRSGQHQQRQSRERRAVE